MVGCLQVYIPALYIVFLFVKTENSNFIKEIKLGENLGKVCENSRADVLVWSRILPSVRLGFLQAMKAQRTMYYFLVFHVIHKEGPRLNSWL